VGLLKCAHHQWAKRGTGKKPSENCQFRDYGCGTRSIHLEAEEREDNENWYGQAGRNKEGRASFNERLGIEGRRIFVSALDI